MNGLTRDDMEVLLEAVKEWENKGLLTEVLGGLMTSMGAKTQEEAKAKLDKYTVELKKKDDEKRVRKERSIILQAKLIQMRDAMAIEEVTS